LVISSQYSAFIFPKSICWREVLVDITGLLGHPRADVAGSSGGAQFLKQHYVLVLKKLAGGGQGQSSIRVPAPGRQLHIRKAAVDVQPAAAGPVAHLRPLNTPRS
jgi:hypothetical protein